MKESNLMRLIQLSLSRAGVTSFRNNTGTGWVGRYFRPSKQMAISVGPRDIVLYDARPLHSGLCKGSSDLIGWTPITITQEMVGGRVAVFSAFEIKSEKGKLSPEQNNFIHTVNRAGGMATSTNSIDGAIDDLNRMRKSCGHENKY